MRRKKCVRNIKKALYNMAEEYGGKNMAEEYGGRIWRKNTIWRRQNCDKHQIRIAAIVIIVTIVIIVIIVNIVY